MKIRVHSDCDRSAHTHTAFFLRCARCRQSERKAAGAEQPPRSRARSGWPAGPPHAGTNEWGQPTHAAAEWAARRGKAAPTMPLGNWVAPPRNAARHRNFQISLDLARCRASGCRAWGAEGPQRAEGEPANVCGRTRGTQRVSPLSGAAALLRGSPPLGGARVGGAGGMLRGSVRCDRSSTNKCACVRRASGHLR